MLMQFWRTIGLKTIGGTMVIWGLSMSGCQIKIPRAESQAFCDKVTGVVTLDSQPLGQARVILIPYHLGEDADHENPISFGTTDGQGRFELKINDSKTGAVAGRHYVVISRPDYVPELELEKLTQLSKSQAQAQHESAKEDLPTMEPDSASDSESDEAPSLPILRFLDGAERHDLVPAKYNSQSELRIEIKPGAAQVVDFALTSKTP